MNKRCFQATSGKTLEWPPTFVTGWKSGVVPRFPKRSIAFSPENHKQFAAGQTDRKSTMP